jgi:hypothetical protein
VKVTKNLYTKDFIMKKLVLVLLVLAVVSASAFAFEILSYPPPLEGGGNIMIDVGLGLRYLGLTGHKMAMPPLFLNVEYALPVGVPISVGGGISVGMWKWSWWGYGYKVTYITPHVRANWHWGLDVPWLDLYTGMSLGADIAIVKWNESWMDNYRGSGMAGSRFYWAFQGGAHFYFSKYFGAVVETGWPYWLKAGLALKFGGKGGGSSSSDSSK